MSNDMKPLGYWEQLEDPTAVVVTLSNGRRLCVAAAGISGEWTDRLPTAEERAEARELAAQARE